MSADNIEFLTEAECRLEEARLRAATAKENLRLAECEFREAAAELRALEIVIKAERGPDDERT